MEYGNRTYEYNISLSEMNYCIQMVESCILNGTKLPHYKNDPNKNHFIEDFYNVLTDFIKSGNKFTISPVSL